MNAIIRHDHHPKRLEGRARGSERVVRFGATDGYGGELAGQPLWHARPVRSKAVCDERQVDLFRLFTACFGLAIYLGVPTAAVVYLGSLMIR